MQDTAVHEKMLIGIMCAIMCAWKHPKLVRKDLDIQLGKDDINIPEAFCREQPEATSNETRPFLVPAGT